MPFGSRVGNGVGVYVDVDVGVGGSGVGEVVGVAVGVRVGVWVEVAVAVGSGVRLGVELGAAACREVSGVGVGGTDVALDLGQPGAVTWNEQFPTTSDSRTATNATPPNQRFLDLFT